MVKSVFALSMVGIVLAACSTNGSYTNRNYAPITQFSTQLVNAPAAGVETEAEPGKAVLTSARNYTMPAINLEQDLQHEGKYSDVYSSRITIPAGTLTASGADGSGTFYESSAPIQYVYHHIAKNIDLEPELLKGGIYVPKDSAKPAEVYWFWEGESTPSSSLHPGVPYKTVISEKFGKDGFKRELIYSGISNNTVSMLYREYKDDSGRASFYHDLRFDLAQGGNVIAYQGARLQVLKADNSKLRYKVLQPLN